MNKNKKNLLIIAVVLLVALGIYFLFKDDHASMENQGKTQGPAMEFNNIEMKEDKDGNAVWRLKAGYVAMSRDKNHADMKDIDGYFKRTTRSSTSRQTRAGMTARRKRFISKAMWKDTPVTASFSTQKTCPMMEIRKYFPAINFSRLKKTAACSQQIASPAIECLKS